MIFQRHQNVAATPPAIAGDLFGEMYLADRASDAAAAPRLAWRAFLPGLLLCGLGSIAAAWFSEHYGMPIILMGLLIGLALAFAAQDERTHAGLDFASRTCLRFGIVILGTQVTFAQIGALGFVPFLALLAVMAAAFGAALLAARAFAQPQEAGVLAGGATAICGASAALALYGVIGKERLSQAQFALTLVGIALMSALAMSVYPVLANQLGLDDRQAGFLIGASIHDVAQAIGGGYAFSDAAGANATIVKLARVALLAPVVALVSLFYPAPAGAGGRQPIWRRVALPWFIAAFLGMVALNSLISVPQPVVAAGLTLSKTLLLLAVTATAMRSRMERLLETGWQTFAPVLAATLASFVVALAFAWALL